MLGGLVRTRIRAAEQAYRDGRLDEALRMVCQPDLHTHARSQRLLARLGKAFLDRARQHYRAERFREAMSDLTSADRCGGYDDDVTELRGQVLAVAGEVARQRKEHQKQIEQARQRIERGSLTAGGKLLADLPDDDPHACKLREQMDDRGQRADQLITAAQSMLDHDRLADAVEKITEARRLVVHDQRVVSLESAVCERILQRASDAFAAGQIARATGELASLQSLGREVTGRVELSDRIDLAESAAAGLMAGRYDDAHRAIRKLEIQCPSVDWIKQTAIQLAALADNLLAIQAGPLGALNVKPAEPVIARPMQRNAATDETVVLADHRRPGVTSGALPDRLLMLIEGGASVLLLRDQRVDIGRAASDAPAAICLLADLSERHSQIVRIEDDYFLISSHDAQVNGRRAGQQLLRDGDRIVRGNRAKMMFRLPSPRSVSARLDLSDSTRMPADVRQVVLFQRTLMMGGGRRSHIMCPHAASKLILFERGDALWVRPQGPPGREDDAVPVELGTSMEIGGVSFVIQPWRHRRPGMSRI